MDCADCGKELTPDEGYETIFRCRNPRCPSHNQPVYASKY